jgi:hypothetical protein
MCASRVEAVNNIKKKEEEAAREERPYFGQAVLENWYRNHYSHIVRFAVCMYPAPGYLDLS